MNQGVPHESTNAPGNGSPPRALSEDQWRAVWSLFEAVSEAGAVERARLLTASGAEAGVVDEVLAMLAKSGEPVDLGQRSGVKVGRFAVISLIGRGGMAEVYLARDTELDRPAALKFVSIGNVGGKSVERSIREAKAASAVNHPNIVTVYEVIRTAEMLVIAMELVEGRPLRHFCGAPGGIGQVAEWGHQIASAVAAAHAEGILHLDLKPENIMVRNDGILKILDFGLARFVEQEGSVSSRYSGTLRYMAPEQYLSEDPTTGTDVFTLGLVLFELFTGEHPFAAATLFETAHAIATRQAPVPSSRNERITPELDRLLLAMLDKDPMGRPPAAQVAQSLLRLSHPANPQPAVPAAVPSREPARPRSGWGTRLIAGAAVLAALAGAALWTRKPRPASPPASTLIRAAGPDDAIPPRHFYAIHPKGNVAVYLDDSTDTSGYRWPAERAALPAIEGVNWASFRKVFPGGDGILYAITADGLLRYFRLLDPWRNSGPMRWSTDSNMVIGTGWDGVRDAVAMSRPVWRSPAGTAMTLETTLVRDGVLWAFRDAGKTALFQHGWAAGGRPLSADLGKTGIDYTVHYGAPTMPPGHSCANCQILEGGEGLTFALSRDGLLWRYRIRATGGWAEPKGRAIRDRAGVQIGHEWNMWAHVLAAPGAYSIEGYVSTERPGSSRAAPTMSLHPGDPVPVRVSTFSPAYTIRLLRLEGRLDEGAGLVDGRLAGSPLTRQAPPGSNFKKPRDSGMLAKGAAWTSDGPDPRLPPDALPGLYAAELTTPSGGRALAPFVVKPRPADRPKSIAVIANAMTWNAYSHWGGNGEPVLESSFERPLLEAPLVGGVSRAAGLTDRNPRAFNQLVRAEVWINSWLDSLARRDPKYGYDAFTDLDLHVGIPRLDRYQVIVIHTLPQFWTDRMRDHLEQYLNAGGHLVYLAGKGMFQRAVITDEGKMRAPSAGLRCVMPSEGPPPLAANPCPTVDLFRWSNSTYPDGRSERAVAGLAFEPSIPHFDPPRKGNHFVVLSAHPFLASGTGLRAGSALGKVEGLAGLMAADWGQAWRSTGAVYHEFQDQMATPAHATTIGEDVADSFGEPRASIVFRETGAGGWVFSIGATTVGGVLAVDPVLQRVVTNALDAALAARRP